MLMEMLKNARKDDVVRWALPALYWAFALFVVACWLFARPPELLEQENRYRARWPYASLESVADSSWGKKVESWMADHVPAREFFVGVYSYWRYASGRQAAESIYRDSRGMLVEAPALLDAEDLLERLAKLADFAESSGLPATLIIPPSAGYIAKPYLPARLWDGYHDDEIYRLAQGYLGDGVGPSSSPNSSPSSGSSHGSTSSLKLCDLRPAFEAAGGEQLLFYRTDHHWTMRGAYAAYTALGAQLGYAPLAPSDFSISRYPGFFGTTYSRSGLWFTPGDEVEAWELRGGAWSVRFSDAEGKEWGSMHFLQNLEKKDKYQIYLDGNHPLAVVENLANGGEGGTLLVIKDSYADSLVPLLAAHYAKLVLVDPRYYRSPASELLDAHGVDEVLMVYSMENIANNMDIMRLR